MDVYYFFGFEIALLQVTKIVLILLVCNRIDLSS